MSFHIANVTFGYTEEPVLRDVTFDVPAGDFLTILGPNGCGKSTLLRILNRILLPQEGTVKLEETPLGDFSRRALAGTIGFVPQDSSWVFPFTVLEMVLMGRSPHLGRFGFERTADVEISLQAMRLADIEYLADKPVTALSGGERQRVLIARALAQQPRILLLDEPNAHLDIGHQMDVFQLLREQHGRGTMTVVCVSHDLNLAAAFSRRVLLLGPKPPGKGNTVVAVGTPDEVFTREHITSVFSTDVVIDRHPAAPVPRISLNPAGRGGIRPLDRAQG
ncbi:MAG: ABC transporter ATP-binding protein, partial [Bacteroidota bacterium]